MNTDYFNTIHWSVTIGTNPRYDLKNQKRMDIGEFTALFQHLAEEEQKQSGVWITAVITPSRLAYRMPVGRRICLHSDWQLQHGICGGGRLSSCSEESAAKTEERAEAGHIYS